MSRKIGVVNNLNLLYDLVFKIHDDEINASAKVLAHITL